MSVADLTYTDFEEIFRASRGVLVHHWTTAPYLRRDLLARLCCKRSEARAKLARFDDHQMDVLTREILEYRSDFRALN